MNAQTLKVAAADQEVLRATWDNPFCLPTRWLKDAMAQRGIKLTEDRINKALGRFYRKYGGKLSALTPHKALMLQKAREIAPFPYSDQTLLDVIGQADTERGAMARVQKFVASQKQAA